ncbi:MAG TPA: MMPL family transporter, partial [Microlunatus sp.]|nr:MMPL family transporter [Microlunatus sp.]
MSSMLYRLGRYAARRRIAMLITWLVVLAAVGGTAGLIGKSFDDAFTLPGTESQAALDSLSRTFPEVSGSSARLIVVAPDGGSVR